MRRRKTAIFFLALGITLSGLAVALNVGWILLNTREVVLLVMGIIFFALIITGLILNTIFLVREIRRNEQHDTFLNSVTHELKTPIASIRLYLETLKSRDIDEAKRAEFYDVMLQDSDRLLNTVEQVLRAGKTGQRRRQLNASTINFGEMVRESVELARTRYHLSDGSLQFNESRNGSERAVVHGDEEELRAAVSNLIDNAIKYSMEEIKVNVSVEA